jgi:flagellar assembly factor FliW
MTMMTERAEQLSFVEPLPGFPDECDYTLTSIDPNAMLYSLRSVHAPDLRFVLTPAEAFFGDYHPDVISAVAAVLGSADVELLLILTIRSGLADATANLRAPVAVAASTGRAVQVVLEDETLPLREPLLRP